MKSYVVLTPPEGGRFDEKAIFVRDGFSLLALLMPVIWFLWHRMWWWALGYLTVSILLGWAIERTEWSGTGIAAALLLSLFAGLEGRIMRVRTLERRGWTVREMIAAPDRDAAESLYFATAEDVRSKTAPTAASGRGFAAPHRPALSSGGPALGLFDHDERR